MFIDFPEVVHGLLKPFEVDGQDSGRTEYEKLFGSVAINSFRFGIFRSIVFSSRLWCHFRM